MAMNLSQALPLFTNEIVAKYSDHQKPKSFGRSFFLEVSTATKLASILSERGINAVASDVPRGSDGNLNVFDKMTQNTMLPPFFNEYFNLVELDSYDYLFVNGAPASKAAWGRFIDDVATKLTWCMDKIDRRYELQCWQVLLTGIVTMVNGENVSYGRRSASLRDIGAGSYWSSVANDPYLIVREGATFLQEYGKMGGNDIDIIFGRNAWRYWQETTPVKNRNLQLKNNLETLVKAQRDSTGKTYIGSTTIDMWNINLWTYGDFYENSDGTTKTPYMDPNKIVMVPAEGPLGTLTYTAIPEVLDHREMPSKGKFHLWEDINQRRGYHDYGVKSAGVPLLAAIDKVFTAKVC